MLSKGVTKAIDAFFWVLGFLRLHTDLGSDMPMMVYPDTTSKPKEIEALLEEKKGESFKLAFQKAMGEKINPRFDRIIIFSEAKGNIYSLHVVKENSAGVIVSILYPLDPTIPKYYVHGICPTPGKALPYLKVSAHELDVLCYLIIGRMKYHPIPPRKSRHPKEQLALG